MSDNNLDLALLYLQSVVTQIEVHLKRYLAISNPPLLYQAMQYALLGGGKRFRAALAFLGAYGEEELAIPAACAVEMVHAYSLIHDDLPCMDNDDFRRGKPSCHIAFGEAIALLAGDALLTKAFETVMELKNNSLMASLELAKAAGAAGMVGGQVMDLEAENKKLTPAELGTLHAKKTGALITVALKMGALSAKREKFLASLTVYGENIGLAFQITDDILDVEGKASTLGKTPGKDVILNKSTYTTLYGLEKAKQLAKEACVRAQKAAIGLPGEEILLGLASYILSRKS